MEFQSIIIKHSSEKDPILLKATVSLSALTEHVKFVPQAEPGISAIVRPNGVILENEAAIVELIARTGKTNYKLIPPNNVSLAELQEWLHLGIQFRAVDPNDAKAVSAYLDRLNVRLALRTCIVGYSVSVADVAFWSAITAFSGASQVFQKMLFKSVHIKRWMTLLEEIEELAPFVKKVEEKKKEDTRGEQQKEWEKLLGKIGSWDKLNLPEAKEGAVVTRFPPEPSGFLHIGHAKAVFLNSHYAKMYKGKMLIRFDDTNPVKEKEEYEEAILKDLQKLGIDTSSVSHTSDYFQDILDHCTNLIKKGEAYCDFTSAEEMADQRIKLQESKCRSHSVEENLRLWEEMQKGSEEGKKCLVRLKMDPKSKVGCLRDPGIYRVVLDAHHHRTGDKYKVYPLYDFACPIVDSVEGISHALRSQEYHDRNALYYHVLEVCGLRKVYIEDFARLNFTYTLMSKRKLQWFVDNKKVSGWDDPSFPTIQGILRRGLQVETLRMFVLALGSSKRPVNMDINKLWAVNKSLIDDNCPRYHAVACDGAGVVEISNFPQKDPIEIEVLKHVKNEALGKKKMYFTPKIYLEKEDVDTIEDGEEITLRQWGNCFIRKQDGKLVGELNPTGDFKKTSKKLHFLPCDERYPLIEVLLREYDSLITKEKLVAEDKFEDFVNPVIMQETRAWCDSNVKDLKLGDCIQLERRGYFIVDKPYSGDGPAILNMIPDGKSKSMSVIAGKVERKGQSSSAN